MHKILTGVNPYFLLPICQFICSISLLSDGHDIWPGKCPMTDIASAIHMYSTMVICRGGRYSSYIVVPQYYFEAITVSRKILLSGIITILILSRFAK